VSRAQLSQVRSRARREALLAAAIELFAEGGARSVTHRAVAARAGLPPATTTYYFASIEELVREALATHLAGWIEVLEALADVEMDPSIDLASTSEFVTGVFATRSPEKAGTELAIYLAAVERLGILAARDLASQAVALIAGSALRRQSAQYDDAEEARLLTSAIRHLVAGHLAAADPHVGT
jgi:TetR/AcrR family transcriptional regulator, regulator of biofilm formation and stress response